MGAAPHVFGCSRCRRDWYHNNRRNESYLNKGRISRCEPTGRTKPVPLGRGGMRSVFTRYEYTCLDCQHVGWTRHIDFARKCDMLGIEPCSEDETGRKRFKKVQEKKR